ncbi:hypothetical protein GNF18_10455 [Ligilactobacillus pobuzihii]|uniref:hypothetical protein n=1 Tax=Ligilactobacillus pobuzihii TaxID=449659 RepID=UPI0019D150D2|nr:hypothetical protein [Ligilactobacillus pobuzihii]MBN7275562.1 hypothetical protein [Ligilactobacillus pobuzihii]
MNNPDFSPEEDLTVLGKLNTVKGAIIKVMIHTDKKNKLYYLFVKLETFNSFKKTKRALGFMANIDNDGIKNITDNKTTFGVKDVISFYIMMVIS